MTSSVLFLASATPTLEKKSFKNIADWFLKNAFAKNILKWCTVYYESNLIENNDK